MFKGNLSKKLLSAAVGITVIVSSIPAFSVSAHNADDFWDYYVSSASITGSGTSSSPYVLDSANDLAAFAYSINSSSTTSPYLDAYVELGADINLSAHDWIPIGVSSLAPSQDHTLIGFRGVFNGAGHTISGMTISYSQSELPAYVSGNAYAGLFGVMSGGSVANLIMSGVSISTNMPYAGGLAGMVYTRSITEDIRYSYIEGLYVGGSITSTASTGYAGSVAGVFETMGNYSQAVPPLGGDITNCQRYMGIYVMDADLMCSLDATNEGYLCGYAYRPGGLHNSYYSREITKINTMSATWYGTASGFSGSSAIAAELYNYVDIEVPTTVTSVTTPPSTGYSGLTTDADNIHIAYKADGVGVTLDLSECIVNDMQYLYHSSYDPVLTVYYLNSGSVVSTTTITMTGTSVVINPDSSYHPYKVVFNGSWT